jgi:hypothetical protein
LILYRDEISLHGNQEYICLPLQGIGEFYGSSDLRGTKNIYIYLFKVLTDLRKHRCRGTKNIYIYHFKVFADFKEVPLQRNKEYIIIYLFNVLADFMEAVTLENQEYLYLPLQGICGFKEAPLQRNQEYIYLPLQGIGGFYGSSDLREPRIFIFTSSRYLRI